MEHRALESSHEMNTGSAYVRYWIMCLQLHSSNSIIIHLRRIKHLAINTEASLLDHVVDAREEPREHCVLHQFKASLW